MSWYENDYRKHWTVVDNGSLIRISSSGSVSVEAEERNREVLFSIKQRLISAGSGAWEVIASSGKNGGGSLVASTSDNWLTSSDLQNGATSGSDRSWVLLRSPLSSTGYFYLLLDYYGTSTARCYITFTKYAPDISSPVVNARPPATGIEWEHSNTVIHSGDVSTGRVTESIAVRASDGSFYLSFVTTTSGGGHYARNLFMFNLISNYRNWDSSEGVSLYLSNLTEPAWYDQSILFQGLHSDGTQVDIAPVWLQTNSDPLPSGSHTNPWVDTYVSAPVWLLSTTTGKKCWRGNLEDIFWTPSMVFDGAILFKSGLVKALKLGPFSCPMFSRAGVV